MTTAAQTRTKRIGFIAFDKPGYATRAYIASSRQDAERAASLEMGESLGALRRFPLDIVLFPMQNDKHLEPADLTKNSGWSSLAPYEA